LDRAAQIAYFEGLLAQHGANYLALDWNSTESQRLRFRILKELLIYGKKASGVSLLDVGCGLGDLYGVLKADGTLKRNKISYTGFDISPKLIEAARKKYPDAKLRPKIFWRSVSSPVLTIFFVLVSSTSARPTGSTISILSKRCFSVCMIWPPTGSESIF